MGKCPPNWRAICTLARANSAQMSKLPAQTVRKASNLAAQQAPSLPSIGERAEHAQRSACSALGRASPGGHAQRPAGACEIQWMPSRIPVEFWHQAKSGIAPCSAMHESPSPWTPTPRASTPWAGDPPCSGACSGAVHRSAPEQANRRQRSAPERFGASERSAPERSSPTRNRGIGALRSDERPRPPGATDRGMSLNLDMRGRRGGRGRPCRAKGGPGRPCRGMTGAGLGCRAMAVLARPGASWHGMARPVPSCPVVARGGPSWPRPKPYPPGTLRKDPMTKAARPRPVRRPRRGSRWT